MRQRDQNGRWMSGKRRPEPALVIKADKPNGSGLSQDNPTAEPKAKRPPVRITEEMIALMKRAGKGPTRLAANPFVLPAVPPSVFPKGRKAKMAMDDFPGLEWGSSTWAQQGWSAEGQFLAALESGYSFMGYPLLSTLAQIPEYRNISEVIATEMTRKWITFRSKAVQADLAAKKEKDADPSEPGKPDGEAPATPPNPTGDDVIDDLKQLLLLQQVSEELDGGGETDEDDEPIEGGELLDEEGAGAELELADKDDDEGGESDEDGGTEQPVEAGGEQGENPDDEGDGQTQEASEKDDKIKELEDAFDRLGVRDIFATIALHDGFFGRAHLFIDMGDVELAPEELVQDIGDGRGDRSKMKVSPLRKIKRLTVVEPVWCYPSSYNSNNPLKPDWYNPETWYVQSQEVHKSRLLTFVGRPVPDMLKPAFAFGGLSLTQMAKPTVDNWIKTRTSVGAIINAFSVFVLATNLQEQLQLGGEQLFHRANLFNSTRDNSGLLIMDKEAEDFTNIAAPLSTLDVLQAQSQEHMASVSRIPIVKLLGIQPAGLNADSEGIIRVFYDTIAAHQNRFFRPHLQTIFWLVQLSLWGEVDEDLTFDFEPLWELDELQKATKRKTDADTANILITAGVLDPEEDRERVANDPDTPYPNIDPSEVPEPPEPELPPGMGFGGGGPGGGPGSGPPKPPGAAAGPPKPNKPPAKGA